MVGLTEDSFTTLKNYSLSDANGISKDGVFTMGGWGPHVSSSGQAD